MPRGRQLRDEVNAIENTSLLKSRIPVNFQNGCWRSRTKFFAAPELNFGVERRKHRKYRAFFHC